MDAATLKYIKDRLPSGHTFIDTEIEAEYVAAGLRANETLARLYERLAAGDRYENVSIGAMSYSKPLLLERAGYWRDATEPGTAAPVGSGGIFSVPITGLTLMPTAETSGNELG